MGDTVAYKLPHNGLLIAKIEYIEWVTSVNKPQWLYSLQGWTMKKKEDELMFVTDALNS